MYQIFFLAVLFNAFAGLILVVGSSKKDEDQSIPGFILDKEYWRQAMPLMIVGIASVLTGFLKVLSVTKGNVPVIGDIVPAGYAVLQGVMLILRSTSIKKKKEGNIVQAPSPLLAYAKFVGVGGILVAAAHFFLHQVLFL